MEILKKNKVIVAMSGGVDSSVAAALAKEAGYEVVGATLRLKHPDPEFSRSQHCANKNDMAAIESVKEQLGIKHFYIDGFSLFEEKVLRSCAMDYVAGRTPNPCCRCNREVKFGMLMELAKSENAKYIMTGHYAKIELIDGKNRLKRGDDPKKDQSYFLYNLTEDEMSYLNFPVGMMLKSEVRRIAEKLGLSTADKPDSQDACFQVENECFGETLRRLFNLPPRPGNFIYQGKIVGRHLGIHQFTLGQRKGLNVALGVPGYISSINEKNGEIQLCTNPEELESKCFYVKQLNLHCTIPDKFETPVQVRYRSKAASAEVERLDAETLKVTPKIPLRAVTPGQAAVFYDNDILIGGGVIDAVENNLCR